MNALCGASIDGDNTFERGMNYEAHLSTCQETACVAERERQMTELTKWTMRKKK